MNRSFTQREKFLLLVLVILMITAGYYWFIAMPVKSRIQEAHTKQEEYENELIVEDAKANRLDEMKKALEDARRSEAKPVSAIPQFDNLENIMIQLDTILSPALNYSLTFSDVIMENSLISRPIQMTFSCDNYEAAKSIIDALYHCVYRCTLDHVTISANTNGRQGEPDINQDPVEVTLTVTFYEKAEE